MTTDQRYEAQQKVHWVLKPILKMFGYAMEKVVDHQEPNNELAYKLNVSMKAAENRLVDDMNKDVLTGGMGAHLTHLRAMMVMMANAEPVWFKKFIATYNEEFSSNGVYEVC